MAARAIAAAAATTTTFLLFLIHPQGALSQRSRPSASSQCDQSSCYPATGDLMIGRESRLKASSTCGLNSTERYCIVSHLEDETNKCFVCDSRRPYGTQNKMSHRVQNIVQTFEGKAGKLRWWQAQNGEQNVYLQLDLEAEFHFTHLILQFKTFRPSGMLIERSYDFGKTWKVYRYFAYDCAETFPRIPTYAVTRIQDVICESKYSDVAPSTAGEVIFRVLPSNIEIRDPYSEEVQDLLKMTNLRVNFTKLHTLGDDLFDSRASIKEKYYYAAYSMVVRGSCSCYGHASRCVPLPGQEDIPNMVHGRCECTHNTKGLNCEQCDDFYNDLPWRPARGRETSACKKCECNQHATRCHFDPAVYEATGRVSGGVCDDCQHNTMGHHCEECKPFFYQDPNRPITDPHVCRPCDCDPIGSEHGGECEGRSDYSLNLVAGRCLCKRYVEGRRCDTCLDGYWNLRAENPDGCEVCGCNSIGTVGNFGCDKGTGECRCKRYVHGRQCDLCLKGYWGLGEDAQGCRPCDCDVGGAYDSGCDQRSGQCNCRPNVDGRRCDHIHPGFFVTTHDWLRYEAEDARGIGNTVEVVREVIPGRPPSWTGRGFMRVNEGSSLEFTVDDIPFSMDYNIVIRYEPQMPLRWDDVRLTIVRPGRVNPHGACANIIPQDDQKKFSLSQGATHYMVTPSACLEKGVRYVIRIDFNRYRSNRLTPEANILVDSIVLMPGTSGHPVMDPDVPSNIKSEFERYRCQEQFMSPTQTPLSEVCRKLIFSSSVSIYDGGLGCNCDPSGSESPVCNAYGGQCRCKPNVMGRRCDQCAPGTYGFGPSGCIECNCSPTGSRERVCDAITGQCPCLPNAFGRQCSQCKRGFFGFPNCRQCQCSGRADECDSETGACINCRDYTGGQNCDRCADGYYGDPRSGCRPCMCPGGRGSGYQHGDTCRLDSRSGQVICECKRGYAGVSCDRCADNYFGDPTVPGGTCERCTCNNNINTDLPGSCDSTTGQCLKCQYNTEGFECERCKTGYYGDARRQDCRQCMCNILGTHRSAVRTCHPVTGQCQCLPHVTGIDCGSCEPNYWKLASGQGCEPCHCDRSGSTSSQCNEFDGQCECRPGRGGRDCSECQDRFWGDPRSQCIPCNCDPRGSSSIQCNRLTGQCECAPGVGGERCDRCARGTTGTLPYCTPCGECFNNWDTIINELRSETSILIKQGSEIKHGGASEAFEEDFLEMERKLEEVRRIVEGTDSSVIGLDEIEERLRVIRQNLTISSQQLGSIDDTTRDSSGRIEIVNNRIEAIKLRIDVLKKNAQDLRDNATKIQELDVSGAFNSVRESHSRSQLAQQKVDSTPNIVHRSEAVRTRAEDIIRTRKAEFDRQINHNDQRIRDINITIYDISRKVVDLNTIVCDGRGDPCDPSCGGAGCGKCGGGISCGAGSVSKSLNALEFSKRAETTLQEKQSQAADALFQIESTKDLCNMAQGDAQMAHNRAEVAKNESETNLNELRMLIRDMTEFLQQGGAKPIDIRTVAEEVLAMSISLTPDQILDLARQINETVRGLTNIEDILEATRNHLRIVMELKNRADRAKASADNVLHTAQRVHTLLGEARDAQSDAETAISNAGSEIRDTEAHLNEIDSQMHNMDIRSNSTLLRVYDMRDRVDAIKRKFAENKIRVDRASMAADSAEIDANEAHDKAIELEDKYTDASFRLNSKYNETKIAKERAILLKTRATDMYDNISRKFLVLQGYEESFHLGEVALSRQLTQINSLNVEMEKYLRDIIGAASFHIACSL